MSEIYDKQTSQLVEAMHDHIDQFVEEDELVVFHQGDDDFPHVDVYWIKPNAEYRPYTMLLTSGLSLNDMDVPESYDTHLEVVMLLPASWLFGGAGNNRQENDWPIHHLRSIAKTPHLFKTWVGLGHTFTISEDENKCFPGTKFNATMLVESITLPGKFLEFNVGKKSVKILSAIPLYPEELEFKLNNDSYALLSRFSDFDISEIISVDRPNTCG